MTLAAGLNSLNLHYLHKSPTLVIFDHFVGWRGLAHGKTPAMAADKPMLMSDLVQILDAREQNAIFDHRQRKISYANCDITKKSFDLYPILCF